jgi:hypothetical protein
MQVFSSSNLYSVFGGGATFQVIPKPFVDFSAWESDALGNRLNAAIAEILAFLQFLLKRLQLGGGFEHMGARAAVGLGRRIALGLLNVLGSDLLKSIETRRFSLLLLQTGS